MNPKQRIFESMKGNEVDRLAWCPFLAYYWDYLPKNIQDIGQVKYMQNIGADPLLRGSHALSTVVYNNCDVIITTKGDTREIKYSTPIGDLSIIRTFSKEGNTWYLTKHPVKSKEDFKLLQYIYENMSFEENIIEFEKDKKILGDEALCMPTIGIMAKTAFQSLIEHWCGTVDLTYSVFDYPEVVEECLETMQNKSQKSIEIAVKSSAESFIFYEDTSTTNYSPNMFEKYIVPEINNWGDIIHKNEKLLVHHACGHLSGVMSQIASSNIDVLESISPYPTGDIELIQARKILPKNIGIIGGIEPTMLVNLDMDELGKYTIDLVNSMKNTRFILANSDSCPPEVAEEKLVRISKLVKEIKWN